MKSINNLGELLLFIIQKLVSVEQQVINMLPELIEKAHHRSVKNAFLHQVKVTEEQKERLLKIQRLVEEKELAKPFAEIEEETVCAAIIKDTHLLMDSNLSAEVNDAAIIACVQNLIHYEISSYGTALAYSKQLKLVKAEELLTETLNEEYDLDDLLTSLATAALNKEAVTASIETKLDKDKPVEEDFTEGFERPEKVSISERTVNSPGGRAGTSHRRYGSGESRGH